MLKFGGNERDVLIYAFRYALGRATYSTSTMSRLIYKNWGVLSEHDKRLFQREIQEAFDLEQYGMECDKASWQIILDLEV